MSCFAADQWRTPARPALTPGLALLCALALTACNAAGATPGPSPYALTASGRLDAQSEARSLVAEQDGIIAEMLVERGSTVIAGQPIMRLSCADRRAALDVARAGAQGAAAQARLVAAGPRPEERIAAEARAEAARIREADARDQQARAEALRARGFVSNRRLEELASAVLEQQAQAKAAAAEAQTRRQGSRPDEKTAAAAAAAAAAANAAAHAANYEKCTLRSPIDGTIVQLLKREGEFSAASSGAPIVVVADLGHMVVRAEIADRDAARAAIGQPVDVWIDGDPRHWRGKISKIASLMGRKTARSLDPSDRFDRDIREAIIDFEGTQPPAIVGLRVNIGVVS